MTAARRRSDAGTEHESSSGSACAGSKTAIVTGASRGIGAATARELARAGMNVVVTARTAETLQEVAASITESGGSAHVVVADGRKPEDLERIVAETVETFGGVDVLVNNAGVANGHPLVEATMEIWDLLIETNLRAPWLLSMLVYPHMKRAGGGVIVNVASSSGLRPDIGLGVYGISKAGLVMLTLVCAKEWARDSIRVNAVAPGLADTDLGAPMVDYLTSRDKPLSALGEIIEPVDVARLIHFISDERGRHMTGSIVSMDGGRVL